MSEPYQFLAIDLGAESGRAELVTLRAILLAQLATQLEELKTL